MEPLIRVQNLMKIYNPGENEVRALVMCLWYRTGRVCGNHRAVGLRKIHLYEYVRMSGVPTSGHYYLNGQRCVIVKR